MSPRSRPWGSRAWRWRQRQGKPAAFHAVACSNPMCRGGASSRDLASVVTDWLMTPSVRAPRAGPVLVAPGPFQLVAVVFEERGVRFVPERERDLGRGGASAHDTRGGQHGHERGDDLSVRCTGGLRLSNAGDERRRISVETDQGGEPRQRAVLWSSSMASPPERSSDEMKRSSQSAILAKVSPSPGMRSLQRGCGRPASARQVEMPPALSAAARSCAREQHEHDHNRIRHHAIATGSLTARRRSRQGSSTAGGGELSSAGLDPAMAVLPFAATAAGAGLVPAAVRVLDGVGLHQLRWRAAGG